MEKITLGSWLSFSVLMLILISGIIIVVWLYFEGKKIPTRIDIQETQYMKLYCGIQKYIKDWEVTEVNYKAIKMLIESLKSHPYQNLKMTQVLERSFNTKYADIIINDRILKSSVMRSKLEVIEKK